MKPHHEKSKFVDHFAAIGISLAVFLFGSATDARSELRLIVDLSDQLLTVADHRGTLHTWPVSTGAPEHRTPIGTFSPVRMHETWYSTKYDGAPMPHSIFFYKGIAIHGTQDVDALGRPVSRGCVRLHPEDAKSLFELVAKFGPSRTKISVQE